MSNNKHLNDTTDSDNLQLAKMFGEIHKLEELPEINSNEGSINWREIIWLLEMLIEEAA